MKILIFGKISDITRKSSLEVSGIKSTDDLKEKLSKDFPELNSSSFAFAVNKKIINKNTELKEGDVVALLPPYSGG